MNHSLKRGPLLANQKNTGEYWSSSLCLMYIWLERRLFITATDSLKSANEIIQSEGVERKLVILHY